MKIITTAVIALFLTIACSAQNAPERNPNSGAKPERPSIDEIFKMDSNKDGLLSKSEVRGPLLNDFEKIDTNKDGFISRPELENAPKPPKGQRPPQQKP